MAHDAEKLRELLARMEKTPAPSRSIDGEIAILLDGYFFEKRGKDRKAWYYPINGRCRRDAEGSGPFSLDRYTASVDAALSIAVKTLPKWEIDIDIAPGGFAGVDMRGPEFSDADPSQYAGSEVMKTAPLAILSALLRALISQAEGEGQNDS